MSPNDCSMSAEIKKVSSIERAFNISSENANNLFDKIALLEEKLRMVLLPERNILENDNGESAEKSLESELVKKIEGTNKNFYIASNKLQYLIDRLDI